MRDPKVMDPNESVDALPKAESVGCFGCAWKLYENHSYRGTEHHLYLVPRSKVVPAFNRNIGKAKIQTLPEGGIYCDMGRLQM